MKLIWQTWAMWQCRWRRLVAKFSTNASGSIWWPNVKPMQVALPSSTHYLVAKFASNASGATKCPILQTMQASGATHCGYRSQKHTMCREGGGCMFIRSTLPPLIPGDCPFGWI